MAGDWAYVLLGARGAGVAGGSLWVLEILLLLHIRKGAQAKLVVGLEDLRVGVQALHLEVLGLKLRPAPLDPAHGVGCDDLAKFLVYLLRFGRQRQTSNIVQVLWDERARPPEI